MEPRTLELENDTINIESYRFDQTNPTQLLQQFLRREKDRRSSFKNGNPEEFNRRIEHNLDLTINSTHTLEKVIEEAVPEKSFITLAKNKQGEIIGINFIGLNNNNESVQSFVGVSYDYLYKGIATKLIEDRHNQLRKLGIHSYTASVKTASRNTIQKQPHTKIETIKPVGDGELVRITFD